MAQNRNKKGRISGLAHFVPVLPIAVQFRLLAEDWKRSCRNLIIDNVFSQ
jgi:hypothetical protein